MHTLFAGRRLPAWAVVCGAISLVSAAAAGAREPVAPSVVARAVSPATGAPVAKRIRLELLGPREFRVVRRSSASSVTLGWPAVRPCAFSTFSLSIRPSEANADTVARSIVPVAEGDGTSAWVGGRGADGTRPTFHGVWRVHSEIRTNDRLTVSGVAATPLRDAYAQPAGGLVVLRLRARTVAGTRCSGTNQFRIGPHVLATVVLAASG